MDEWQTYTTLIKALKTAGKWETALSFLGKAYTHCIIILTRPLDTFTYLKTQ